MMMELIYKRYVALVTRWSNDLLFRARIKLTLAYIGVSVFILAIFSYLLYRALLIGLADSIVDQVPIMAERIRLLEVASTALKSQILIVDFATLLIVFFAGYTLTAVTLSPIREARDRERRFLADAAHELRTPLSVMKSGSEVVLRGEKNLSPRVRRVLTENIEEIDSLTYITNGLLSLASGKQKIFDHNTVIDVRELLTNVVQKLKPLSDAKQIVLSFQNNTEGAEFHVLADQVTLIRAFENLIENGIKYTKPGGSVAVSLSLEKKSAVIRIKDTGIGIASHDLPHITEPFFRANAARTSNEGSGLGLSIVSETIAAHGGSLHIGSVLGVGTTITVRLLLFAQHHFIRS